MLSSEKLLSFMLKKEMHAREASLFSDSKYYAFTHKFNVSADNAAEWLVKFLHESIHYFINNLPLCDIITDYANLFLYLHHFYIQKKIELFEKSGILPTFENKKEGIQHVLAYQSELDEVLISDSKFVEYCRFCIEVFDIYKELLSAQTYFNEGVATYYCTHAVPEAFLFEVMDIPDIFLIAKKLGIPERHIFIFQQSIVEKMQKRQEATAETDDANTDFYQFAYAYTELLSETYGDNYLLLVLIYIMSQNFDIYAHDLLGCSKDERWKLIKEYYSFDAMYFNLILKGDKILPILLDKRMKARESPELFKIISNYTSPAPELALPDLYSALDKRFFYHPRVLNEIEKVLSRPMTRVDFKEAYMHMCFQRSGKEEMEFYDNDTIYNTSMKDIEELFKDQSRMLTKADKYVEDRFQTAYDSMCYFVKKAERRN